MSEKLPQRISAVTPLGEAIDGTPVKRKRAPSKSAPEPAVETAYQCACGQRFEDLREAFIHARVCGGGGERTIRCGTYRGYLNHVRTRHENACASCAAAKAEYWRERRARIAAEKEAASAEYWRQYGEYWRQHDAEHEECDPQCECRPQ